MKRYISLLIILMFIAVKLWPQDLSELRIAGKGEYLKSELINKAVRDANGIVCAGLMILSDLDGLSYESNNGVVKINRSPGKDLLFLSPDERMVTVLKTGYKPLKVIINEFGIKFASGTVWKLEVTGSKKVEQVPIVVRVDPSDAVIILDSVSVTSGRPITVQEGKHTVKILRDGYRSVTEQITVSPKEREFPFTLKKDKVSLNVLVYPADASVAVDSISLISGRGFPTEIGLHKLRIERDGYEPEMHDIEVSKINNSFSYQLRKKKYTISIIGDPSDAIMSVDSIRVQGNTTVAEWGYHVLRVENSGYESLSKEIEVMSKQTSFSYSLNKIRTYSFEVSSGIGFIALEGKPKSPPPILSFQYRLSNMFTIELAGGSVDAGDSIKYDNFTFGYLSNKYTIVSLRGRINIYQTGSLETYVGACITFVLNDRTFTSLPLNNSSTRYYDSYMNSDVDRLFGGGFIGARYWVFNKFGLVLETGHHFINLRAGITFTF
ncbi:MAG: PEGA domain-containing protein [bacterium]